MISPNPFTPQSGWEPKIFGGRDEEIGAFKLNLDESLRSRPSHLVLLGDWGAGKTSLLKQFKRIVQERNLLASFCAISRFTEKNTALEAVHFMAEEMLMCFPKANLSQEDVAGLFGKKKSLLHAQVQFKKYLLELWKALGTKLAVVLLDDTQNLLSISNTVDILRAVLSDEEIIKNTNFLFVLSSTPAGWISFIDKHDPIGRFFRKRLLVENLKEEEVRKTVEKTLKDTGVSFDEGVTKKIYQYTLGHPYEVQLLSSHLYDAQTQGEVRPESWENALSSTLKELGNDYFNYLLSKASDREMDLLRILAEEKRPFSIKDLTTLMIVGKRARKFPTANIKNFLYRLEEKGLVKRNDSGNFYIPDLMLSEFIARKVAE